LPKLVGALVNSLPANKALIVLSPISETTNYRGRSSEKSEVGEIQKKTKERYDKSFLEKCKDFYEKHKEKIIVVGTIILKEVVKRVPVLRDISKFLKL
jgi:hypothetical protein